MRRPARWIMTLFMDDNDYALFSSPDLRSWKHLQDLTLPGVSECPDFFELPVDGDPSNTRWVFWGASGGYLLGGFDGNAYEPETDVLQAELGANGYAAQTWSDIPAEDWPDASRSPGCGTDRYPAMPFNQQMTFPGGTDAQDAAGRNQAMQGTGPERVELLHAEDAASGLHGRSGGQRRGRSVSDPRYRIRARSAATRSRTCARPKDGSSWRRRGRPLRRSHGDRG